MNRTIKFIDTQLGVDQVLANKPSLLAIDTEFTRRSTYDPIPSIVQCKTESDSFIIDLLQPLDLSVLKNWLMDSQVIKVMHDCLQDLEVLEDRLDIVPDFVFDTSVAYGFVSTVDSVGYADAVQQFFNVTLSKEPRQADWLQRPIGDELLEYAVGDVEFLLPLSTILTERLESMHRYKWFVEEMRFVLHDHRESVIEDYMRVRGARVLSCQDQVMFRELFNWREQIAREQNIPRNWVVHNDKLLKLARKDVLSNRDLASLCRSRFEHYGESLQGVIKRVSTVIQTGDRRFLSARQRRSILSAFSGICGQAAGTHDVSRSSFGSQSFFSAVIDFYATHLNLPPWFGAWRRHIIGKEVVKVLQSNFDRLDG